MNLCAAEIIYFRSFSGEDVLLATNDRVVLTRPIQSLEGEWGGLPVQHFVGDEGRVEQSLDRMFKDDGFAVYFDKESGYVGTVVHNYCRVIEHCSLLEGNDR